MALNRAVLHRFPRIRDQIVPLAGGHPCGKQIRIVGRLTHHGQNLTSPWIQRYNRARVIADHFFSGVLKIQVEGGDQVVSRNVRFFLQLPHFAAKTVHDHPFKSIFADEHIVVLAFQSGLAYLIAGFEVHEFRHRQLGLGHLTHISQSVRR